jgi:hypothetical protein
MTDELHELEARLLRLSSTHEDLRHERVHLERMLLQMNTQRDLHDNAHSEGECMEYINQFDVADGLSKWRIGEIKEESCTLDYIGQTSETCARLSFKMSNAPLRYSFDLERTLFPAKLRFARKFPKMVASFLKYRMQLIQRSYGRSSLDSFSAVPELVRYLALELVRIDVLAMEIRALEQRHAVTIEFANSGNIILTAHFPKMEDGENVATITFLVSREYPIAPPSATIHSFDEALDVLSLHRLIKRAKPGFGWILRTLDSVKAFVGPWKNNE